MGAAAGQEQIGNLTLPNGVQPQLGPPDTAYGEIYRYELVSDGTADLIELRTLNDWVVIRRLMRVPGVAEVANFGGFQKQYAVTFNQAQLNRYGLALGDVEDAITKNNAAGGGSVVSRGSMSMVVRGKGQIENLDQIQNIFVKSIGGTPVYLKDIASVGDRHPRAQQHLQQGLSGAFGGRHRDDAEGGESFAGVGRESKRP